MRAFDAQLLSAIYDGVVENKKLEPALLALARCFGCDSASIVSFDQVTPKATIAASVGAIDEAARQLYVREFAAHETAPAAFAASPAGTVFASNRMFSNDYLRQSVFLHEFLRPRGVEETMGGTVASRNGRLAFLTIHRGPDRMAFDDDELASVGFALPHLARSLELRRSFEQMNVRVGLLTTAIDRLAVGVVIIGAEHTAVHVNVAARALAARKDGLWFDRQGILHANDRLAEQTLLKLFADVASGGSGGIVRLPRSEARPSYALLVAPLPASVGLEHETQGHGALVLIHDPDHRATDVTGTIVTIFGLPTATARLISALVQGEDAKAYSDRLGLSYETVRHHLKVAFARTGARNQARLLQMVTRALSNLDIRR